MSWRDGTLMKCTWHAGALVNKHQRKETKNIKDEGFVKIISRIRKTYAEKINVYLFWTLSKIDFIGRKNEAWIWKTNKEMKGGW